MVQVPYPSTPPSCASPCTVPQSPPSSSPNVYYTFINPLIHLLYTIDSEAYVQWLLQAVVELLELWRWHYLQFLVILHEIFIMFEFYEGVAVLGSVAWSLPVVVFLLFLVVPSVTLASLFVFLFFFLVLRFIVGLRLHHLTKLSSPWSA